MHIGLLIKVFCRMENMFGPSFDLGLDLAMSTIRVSLPLIFAALAGFFSERSGVVNIALEGKLLIGAFAGAVVAHLTGNAFLGVLAGICAGGIFGLLHGYMCVTLAADQIISGTALNFLAFGLTPVLSKIWFDSTGSTPSLPSSSRLGDGIIAFSLCTVLVIEWWRRNTQTGLWLFFAGEKPSALQSAGVSVRMTRLMAVTVSGLTAGFGGAILSLYLSSAFSRGMTSGRGFMGLAALIAGRWLPGRSVIFCLLFGFLDSIQVRLQGVHFFQNESTGFAGFELPVQFIQMIPYAFTVLVVGGLFTRGSSASLGRSGRAPSALGKSY